MEELFRERRRRAKEMKKKMKRNERIGGKIPQGEGINVKIKLFISRIKTRK